MTLSVFYAVTKDFVCDYTWQKRHGIQVQAQSHELGIPFERSRLLLI